jgi:hypothetical protein
MSRTKMAILALAGMVAAPALWAQEANVRGRVVGTDGRPIAGVEVQVQGTTLSTRSEVDGRFALVDAPGGSSTLTFRRVGYLPTIAIVTVPDTTGLEVSMVASAPELDTVRVIASLNVLAGVVVDSLYRGLPDVAVEMIGGNQKATTDGAGRFTMTSVRSGTVILRLRKLGYAPVTQSLRLDAWRGLLVKMRALPVTLTEAQIRDKSGFGGREFYFNEASQRITVRGGRSAVVSREELAAWSGASLETALMHAPSAAFVAGDIQAAGMRACVLMDGYRAIGPASLNGFRADEVEFVEIYPPGTEMTSSVARNMTTARCPAVRVASTFRRGPLYVVIWSRSD